DADFENLEEAGFHGMLPNYDATPLAEQGKVPFEVCVSLVGQGTGGELFLSQNAVEVGEHFGRIPLLGAYEFAGDFAATIDEVAFGNQRRAVIEGDFRFAVLQIGIAPGGIRDSEVLQKFLVAGWFGVEAHAEYGAATRLDVLLQAIEGRSFFDTGLTVGCPEIE